MPCLIEGCERVHYGLGLCNMHYQRQRKAGEVGSVESLRERGRTCSAPDCTAPHEAGGLCERHYQRLDPLLDQRGLHMAGRIQEQNPAWKEQPTYNGAHKRLMRYAGRASEHDCTICGDQADDWAYDDLDPNVLVDTAGLSYSTVADHYFPLCKRCHARVDRAIA